MPADTVKVCRPGPFGNPWLVREAMAQQDITEAEAQRLVVSWFREWITSPASDDATHPSGLGGRAQAHQRIMERLPSLRGRNLACWCRLDRPCHADVLLDLANG
jgi:O-succinylbenzoate synthase